MQDKWDKKEAPLPLSENDTHLHQNGSLSWSASAKAQDEYRLASDNERSKEANQIWQSIWCAILHRNRITIKHSICCLPDITRSWTNNLALLSFEARRFSPNCVWHLFVGSSFKGCRWLLLIHSSSRLNEIVQGQKKAVAFQSPLFTVIKGDGTTSKFAPSAIRRRISKWKYFVCKEEKGKKPPTISKWGS